MKRILLAFLMIIAVSLSFSACGGEHTHVYGKWIMVKEPTCQEEGLESRKCLHCGEEEVRSVNIVDHSADYEWITDIEPTCTETGKRHCKCKYCHTNMEHEDVPALGHKIGYWKEIKPATCTEKGLEIRRCTTCNEVLETRDIPMLNHVIGDWENESEPTCTTDGKRVKKCKTCGTVLESEVLPAIGHDYVDEVVSRRTKDAQGVVQHTCTHCKDKQTDTIEDITSVKLFLSGKMSSNLGGPMHYTYTYTILCKGGYMKNYKIAVEVFSDASKSYSVGKYDLVDKREFNISFYDENVLEDMVVCMTIEDGVGNVTKCEFVMYNGYQPTYLEVVLPSA